MRHHLALLVANSLAVFVLLALFASPLYFARNFAKIAGVKSESAYLLISQVEKFPGMGFGQLDNNYSLTFTKNSPSQAYLSILIINNPTGENKTYTIKSASTANKLFFGEDLGSLNTKISVPSQTSVPISLFSPATADQFLQFQITTN